MLGDASTCVHPYPIKNDIVNYIMYTWYMDGHSTCLKHIFPWAPKESVSDL